MVQRLVGRGAEASYGQLERQRVNELRKISWNHLLVCVFVCVYIYIYIYVYYVYMM